MNKKLLALGGAAICLLGILAASGCAQNDNGPSTVHDAATDAKKNTFTPAQRAAFANNPNVPARAKAFFLGQNGGSNASLPPEIAARQKTNKPAGQ